jgi:hypothetical protein
MVWTVLSSTGGPAAVLEGAAYGWTGTELIVWGGRTSATPPAVTHTGGRYVP